MLVRFVSTIAIVFLASVGLSEGAGFSCDPLRVPVRQVSGLETAAACINGNCCGEKGCWVSCPCW